MRYSVGILLTEKSVTLGGVTAALLPTCEIAGLHFGHAASESSTISARGDAGARRRTGDGNRLRAVADDPCGGIG